MATDETNKTMDLRSPAFGDHTLMPDRYSHEHGDVCPPLQWVDVPSGTAELALACEDPDAPGGVFVHWMLAGIAPERTGIDAGEPPENAVEGRNGAGAEGYLGPHPPVGDEPHRYFFRLYALGEPTGLEPGFGVDEFARHIGRPLSRATLVGTFGR